MWSTSEGWKAESPLEPPNDFESGTTGPRDWESSALPLEHSYISLSLSVPSYLKNDLESFLIYIAYKFSNLLPFCFLLIGDTLNFYSRHIKLFRKSLIFLNSVSNIRKNVENCKLLIVPLSFLAVTCIKSSKNTSSYFEGNHVARIKLCHSFLLLNPLSANPTKWSDLLKRFFGCCRQIVWVCLTILRCWRLKAYIEEMKLI